MYIYLHKYKVFWIIKLFRVEDYETALKEWEENRPPASASSVDPFGHYKKRVSYT